MAAVTAKSEANIVPIRALSDGEALAWIAAKGKTETTATALARDWDWNPTKVRRRLANWSSAGLIEVKHGLRGRTLITPLPRPVAAPSGGPAVVAPTLEPVTAPAVDIATETAVVPLPSTLPIPETVDLSSGPRTISLIMIFLDSDGEESGCR